MSGDTSEPEVEQLAGEEYRRLKAAARMLATTDQSDLQGAMLIVADDSGIQTVPYVHPDQDPREMSLWMLGAFLMHMDASTPPSVGPMAIADHAVALVNDGEPDDEEVL